MITILYVSESLLPIKLALKEAEKIIAHAAERNKSLGITGAIMFSGTHFAQIIEGIADTVEVLMGRIENDPRHTIKAVLHRRPITRPEFASWSSGYCGLSVFVETVITRALEGSREGEVSETAALVQLMRDMA